MIGSARPNSLNEVKESLSYTAKRPGAPMRAAESRGSRHPAWPGLSSGSEFGWAGRNSFLMSFVHAARKPATGSFIRTGHMTVRDVLFKAWLLPVAPYDE